MSIAAATRGAPAEAGSSMPGDGTGPPAPRYPPSMTLALIGIGGAAGAVARYLVGGWVATVAGESFPYGTLVVNLSGSFLLGILFAASTERALLSPDVRIPLAVGFLGAYTTFSTLMLETWRLGEDGALVGALANLGISSVLGLVAIWAGLAIGRAI